MKIQINKWVPEKYKFQSYEEAEVIEADSLQHLNDHDDYGVRYAIRKGDQFIREIEGATLSLLGGEIAVQGYVADDNPGSYHTDTLRREYWFVIER